MESSEHYPRVAVVTGAGSGVGRGVAVRLLERGWKVALAGRRPEPLHAVAGASEHALVVPTDVTSEDEVARLFAAVADHWGQLGLLFNNAGTFGQARPIGELDLDEWNATVGVNLTGMMLGAKHAFRQMAAQQPPGGRIINNGSLAAHVPRPHSAPYAATKHAVAGLTKAIALDGREVGVQAGQIDIGNTQTTMMSDVGANSGALQPDGSRMVEPTFDVTEAARAAVFMAEAPREVTIDAMTITATGMPYGGRG